MTALLMGAWGLVMIMAVLVIEHRLARIQKALQPQPRRFRIRGIGDAP